MNGTETKSVANPEVQAAINFLGGPAQVGRLRGLTTWSISKWIREGLPTDQTLWLAERTGWRWTPHQLCPAIYPHPDDGLPVLFRRAARRAADGAGA